MGAAACCISIRFLRDKKVLGPAFFKRLVGMEGAKPLPRFPQKAKAYSLRLGRNPKRRKGGPQAARGCPRGRNFFEIAA